MPAEPLGKRIRRVMPSLSNIEALDLAGVIERIAAALAPERIYAFGSRTRDDATAESDVDLLIVVRKADEPEYRLAQAAYRAAMPYRFSLDILVMTEDEFDRRSQTVASLPATVLREGQMLYAA